MSRILLADDSPHAQRMGERILSEEGYEVVTVSDGDSALVRLADVDPDLVLADISMPRRSGYDLCHYVKISPYHRHTRVVLTAGAHEPVDEEQTRRVQADGLLRKPFEASVLLNTLKPLLELARQQRGESLPHPRAAAGAGGVHPQAPFVAVIDPQQVRAAVTVALDASFSGLVEEITEKILVALSAAVGSRGAESV